MKKTIILGIVCLLILQGCTQSNPELDSFAQCLTDQGVQMYGAFWCSHCATVKKEFGSSFEYINYIECDARGKNEQSELCIEKEIEGYPTFIFADESRIPGVASLETLAEKTGCELG